MAFHQKRSLDSGIRTKERSFYEKNSVSASRAFGHTRADLRDQEIS